MKKALIILSYFLLFVACTKGIWVAKNVFRPKRPNFSILKKAFIANVLINTNYFYVYKTSYTSDSQVRVMYDFTGFYPDGRVIGVSLNDLDKLSQMNSWQTAPIIGHYTTKGNTIEFEVFLPTDGGLYETREGIIQKNTILRKKFSSNMYKKENRYDTLVVSSFPLE